MDPEFARQNPGRVIDDREANSDLVSRTVFPEIKEDIGSAEGHVQQSREVVDGPRVPEVAELQGRLVGDADECVPLLLAPPGEGGPHHAEGDRTFSHRRPSHRTLSHRHLHIRLVSHKDIFTLRQFHTRTLSHTDSFT